MDMEKYSRDVLVCRKLLTRLNKRELELEFRSLFLSKLNLKSFIKKLKDIEYNLSPEMLIPVVTASRKELSTIYEERV